MIITEISGFFFYVVTLNSVYLMSPSFLVMALPKVLKAADVFWPAVDNVSEVFLNLETKNI